MHNHNHSNYLEHEHEYTLKHELICHLPYAIFSVAFALGILSFVTYLSLGVETRMVCKGSKVLFHSFHFMHIVFAATGTIITYLRFSSNWLKACIVGVVSPLFFCTISDVVLPYIGGRMLGVPMKFHLCLYSEWMNVLPFLIIGIVNGFVLAKHGHDRQGFYSVFSHAGHIFISSLASTFYLVSNGCTDWYKMIGIIFFFLIFSVVVPCTLSDVVVPMIVARTDKKK